ncbi:NAD(P)-binding protein [Xylaria grammica]|nr:NAD(P)-binding protein [Xylaria grammica]
MALSCLFVSQATSNLYLLTIKPKLLDKDVRLDYKTTIITGASLGLGLEATKEMAARGLARVILGVRNIQKGEAAREEILSQSPGIQVLVWLIDEFLLFRKRAAKLDRLDPVILNADVENVDYLQSKMGHESHIQVPSLVNFVGNGTSKLLNVPWMRELSARTIKLEMHILINTANPGFRASSLHKADPTASKAIKLLAWTAVQGGRCLTDAATLHGD